MATVTLDSRTYHELESYARSNNTNVTEVVRISVLNFLNQFDTKSFDSKVKAKASPLPAHLKKMRGILADVEDPADERLNYLLGKPND